MSYCLTETLTKKIKEILVSKGIDDPGSGIDWKN